MSKFSAAVQASRQLTGGRQNEMMVGTGLIQPMRRGIG
jgi:hypothetical protein